MENLRLWQVALRLMWQCIKQPSLARKLALEADDYTRIRTVGLDAYGKDHVIIRLDSRWDDSPWPDYDTVI